MARGMLTRRSATPERSAPSHCTVCQPMTRKFEQLEVYGALLVQVLGLNAEVHGEY